MANLLKRTAKGGGMLNTRVDALATVPSFVLHSTAPLFTCTSSTSAPERSAKPPSCRGARATKATASAPETLNTTHSGSPPRDTLREKKVVRLRSPASMQFLLPPLAKELARQVPPAARFAASVTSRLPAGVP